MYTQVPYTLVMLYSLLPLVRSRVNPLSGPLPVLVPNWIVCLLAAPICLVARAVVRAENTCMGGVGLFFYPPLKAPCARIPGHIPLQGRSHFSAERLPRVAD